MVFVATGRAAAANAGTADVIWLQALILGAYLGSFKIRTVVRAHRLIPFEVAQSAGALAVGFGGLVFLLSGSAVGLQILAVVCLLLAGGAYATAFGFSETHRPYPNFFFQSILACFFTIAGLVVGLGSTRAAIGYAALAAVTLALARRYHRSTLALHAAVYATGATVASGLVATATLAMTTPIAATVPVPGVVLIATLAVLFAAIALPVRDARERWPYLMPAVRCVAAAVATWTAGGVIVSYVLAMVPGSLDVSQLSTIRTIVLVASAIAVAAVGWRPAGREGSWLTYPLLTIAGLKLVFVDFMQGRPTTLFAALAVYGAALIIAPRMLRRPVAGSERAVSKEAALPVLSSSHPQTIVR
jgi:hypothetical protein